MKALVCELCGSNSFTKDDDFFTCDYCRTKYSPEQAKKMMIEGTVRVDRSHEVVNLLTLAHAALDNANPDEAYDYANRVLEIDPENVAGWVIKGKAAGWSSTLTNFRIGEMLGAFTTAERLTPEADREALRADCADVLNRVATTIHNLSWNHTNQFIQADGAWEDHIARSQQVIQALETSYEWGGGRQPLDNIVVVAANLITGIRYQQLGGGSGVRYLTPEFQLQMQHVIDQAAAQLRTFEPEYTAPRPASPQSGCFVVTATMGDEQAHPVVVLRQYRDDVLVGSRPGRAFIDWYYEHGPGIADWIRPSRVLRAVSLGLVVLPATLLASAALWRRSRRIG